MNVTIANQGDCTENINLTLHANNTVIANYIGTLTNASIDTLRFDWNTTGFAKGYYLINAHVLPVAGEVDVADNTLDYNGVYITIPGDINIDKKVSIHDLWALGKAYNSDTNMSEWNPNADIINDGIVDSLDLLLLDINYGHKD